MTLQDIERGEAKVLALLKRLALLAALTSALCVAVSGYRPALADSTPAASAMPAGGAATALRGGLLLSGGALGKQAASSRAVLQASDGSVVPLPGLQVPRADHTATLLPDGRVFVFGGKGGEGSLVQESEILDPDTGLSQVQRPTGLRPRAKHLATVLSDGRVVIAGGVDANGQPVREIDVFDPRSGDSQTLATKLPGAVLPGAAHLLPDGSVLWSCPAALSKAAPQSGCSQRLDPESGSIQSVADATAVALLDRLSRSEAPALVKASPAAQSSGVPVDASLMLRLSSRMDVNSLTPASVTLRGPEGEVAVKVIAVEGGVLAFVTPLQQLLPSSAYSLFVNGARSVAGQPLPLLALGFNTQSLTATPTSAAADSPKNGSSAVNSANAAALARSVGGGSSSPGVQSTTTDTETDEAWVPAAEHRRGNWLSRREHLASRSFPRHAELRAVVEARTPRVADPISLMTARLASLQADEDRGPSWQALQQAFSAQVERPRARALSATAITSTADSASLTGQLLRLNGLPLSNATLSMGKATTKTDANGEFTLQGIPSGDQVLVIDGRTASTKTSSYGRFEYLHHVEAGQANILPFTVWMPKLDTKHAIRIDSPTKRDTVIANPSMPGLEIVLPAGSVVRDADGKIVTEVSLTPVPADQAPYPMPYADVPLHYTLQPGGAVIQSIDGKPRAAIVRYPNYTRYSPGTPVQLFDYDARGRGWYVYSDAQVSADGQRITSERDFLIYQFTTTSYSSGGPAGPPPPPPTCGGAGPGGPPPPGGGGGGGSSGSGSASSGCGGDPVDLMNGSFRETERDLFVDDVIPIDLLRIYRGNSATSGLSPLVKSFGTDFTHQYDVYLYFDTVSHKQVQMVLADGTRVNFDNPAGSVGSGSYNSLAYRSSAEQGPWRNAVVQKSSAMFIVTFRDGRRWGFSNYNARLIWIEDRLGNRLTVDRSEIYRTRITSPSGRYVELTYDAQYRINAATDNIGRQFIYTYHPGTNNLQSVTDPAGKKRTYGWTAANRLKQVTDPNGKLVIDNTYEIVNIPAGTCTPVGTNSPALNNYETGRVKSQILADGTSFSYWYSSTATQSQCAGGTVFLPPSLQTDVIDRRTIGRRVQFDARGNVIKNIAAIGHPEQQITTFTYTDHLLTSVTDPLNRQTTFQYDAAGNLKTLTRLAGTADAVVTSATYDPVFNQPLTVTDPLGHTRTLRYDTRGNLLSITDPLSHVTRFAYDDQGLLISTTDPLGKTSRFSYASADPLSVTDPLGRTAKQLTDAVGRVTTTVDPLGNTTVNTWDSMNRLTQITDALGGFTSFSYDNNSQLLSHTDAKNQTTRYTYWPTGQVKDKTDPLSKVESYLYEPGGQLKQRTDRKGQVSGVTYDTLGRVKTIGFGATATTPTAYTSTVSLTWDNANRLTQTVDTQGGVSKTITRTYDNLDRLTQESTDQGEVNYTFDKASRRTSMTLRNGPAGSQVAQPTLSYTWDDADRLTLITQAAGPSNANQAQTVAFQYDDADRVTKTTYTGGMSVNTTYTDAGEVKTLKYLKADGSVIAQGGYTYDLAGRRIGVSGDLANFIGTQQPDVTSTSYDAANRLITWGTKTFNYDNNGNMLGDGTTKYRWDARDQLVSVADDFTSTTFKYDSEGRRTARTLGSLTTAFNYDGDNFIQELDALGRSGNIRANLITGGIDQHFMRQTIANGQPSLSWVMAEANNSTVVQADSAGNVQKSFQYTPYGSSIATTGASTDSQRYTGREDDGTGLYYYRARYYRPDCMRFISEDPIGWASGQVNNYAYVSGNPISLRDPFGLASCTFSDGVGSYFGNLGDSLRFIKTRENEQLINDTLSEFAKQFRDDAAFRQAVIEHAWNFAKDRPGFVAGRFLTGAAVSIIGGPGVGIPTTLIALTGGVINGVNAGLANPGAVLGVITGGGGGGAPGGCP